mgnify:CR=1 FL=1
MRWLWLVVLLLAGCTPKPTIPPHVIDRMAARVQTICESQHTMTTTTCGEIAMRGFDALFQELGRCLHDQTCAF